MIMKKEKISLLYRLLMIRLKVRILFISTREEVHCNVNVQCSVQYTLLLLCLMLVAKWLRCCATNRKVAGSIPDGLIGIFH